MPIVRYKDKTNLVAERRVWTKDRQHYWNVYLWKTTKDLHQNADPFCNGGKFDGDKVALGCHCPAPILLDLESGELLPKPKMGELHFISKKWDEEIITHELTHVLFHRLKMLCPNPLPILEEDDMGREEIICRCHGRLFPIVYRWLWEIDTPEDWIKVKE
jgi:hypothetical protein